MVAVKAKGRIPNVGYENWRGFCLLQSISLAKHFCGQNLNFAVLCYIWLSYQSFSRIRGQAVSKIIAKKIQDSKGYSF